MSWTLKRKVQALVAGEEGVSRKDWGGRVSVALVYPNTYAVGMSNLGFQTIYAHLNALPDVVCERVFFPDPEDLDEYLRSGAAPFSLESLRPLSDFDLVGFIVGVVERDAIIDGASIHAGDALLGLPSSGLHTNGYSLLRRVLFGDMALGLDDEGLRVLCGAGKLDCGGGAHVIGLDGGCFYGRLDDPLLLRQQLGDALVEEVVGDEAALNSNQK